MRLFPHTPKCDCNADITKATSVRVVVKGKPLRKVRAQMIFHYRAKDQAHFWHWSDDEVVQI